MSDVLPTPEHDLFATAAFHASVRQLVEDEAARLGKTLERLVVEPDPYGNGVRVEVHWT